MGHHHIHFLHIYSPTCLNAAAVIELSLAKVLVALQHKTVMAASCYRE